MLELVAEEVVEDAAVLLGQDGILRPVLGDLRDVVGQDPLQERLGAGPGRLDLPHVADVEDPGPLPHGHVLLADARVLDGHLPAGERDELRTRRDMPVVQGGSLERVCTNGHGVRTLARVLHCARRNYPRCRVLAGLMRKDAAYPAVLILAALLILPAPASAGTYDVVACNADPAATRSTGARTTRGRGRRTARRAGLRLRARSSVVSHTVHARPTGVFFTRRRRRAHRHGGRRRGVDVPGAPGTTIKSVQLWRYCVRAQRQRERSRRHGWWNVIARAGSPGRRHASSPPRDASAIPSRQTASPTVVKGDYPFAELRPVVYEIGARRP